MTGYRLDGLGIESQWGWGFLHLSRPALRPTQPPTQWVLGLSGVKRPRHGIDHPPHSSVEVKERVGLYLYSSSGPLWPVLGWTLPFTFTWVLYQPSNPQSCQKAHSKRRTQQIKMNKSIMGFNPSVVTWVASSVQFNTFEDWTKCPVYSARFLGLKEPPITSHVLRWQLQWMFSFPSLILCSSYLVAQKD